jgi:hypothetical protein
MAQNYTRQSSFADGDTITASLFNNEFNQVVNAFSYSASSDSSTGHKHDGTAGQGGNIPKIGDIDFLNKIVVDSTNNRWGIFVEVAGGPVEQVRIQDGAIVPVTTNDIDLGTGALQFKDIFIDGTANIDSLVLSSGSTVTAILDEDDLVSDSATALATQQSIKAYVDAQVTAQDLDIVGDTGTDAIDLDSETLTFTGGTGITSVVTAGTVTHNIDSTVATLTGTQTLTNKTITSPDIDGGTVDGADITVGAAKTLDVSTGTLTLADNQISGDKVEGGTIAAITITAMTGTLQTAAQPNVTSLGTIASLVATTADINGGTIDGTTIGATTPASVAATTLSTTGIATFGGNVTGKSATFVTTTAASLISIGDTAAGTYSLLRMYGGSGKYNFQVGVQNNVNNAFEITPSTAVGGTTFTTPALLIDGTTGAATFSSTLSVGNIATFTNDNQYLVFNRPTTGDFAYIGTASNTTGGPATDLGIRAENNLILGAGGYGADLTIATTGAATFGGTVDSKGQMIIRRTISPNEQLRLASEDGIVSITSYNGVSTDRVAIHFVQDTTGTDYTPMVIDSSGNLGISESSPVAKIHIQGSGTSGQVTSSLILENSSSGTAGLQITGAAGSSHLDFMYGGGPSTGTNTLTTGMSMTLEGSGAGRVGIGTSSPAETLHVAGAIATTAGISGHGANRATFSQEGAGGAFIQSYGANTLTMGAFVFRQASSDFSLNAIPLTISATGAATFGGEVNVTYAGNLNTTVKATNSSAGTSALARFIAVSDGGNAQLMATSTTYTDIAGAADSMVLNASSLSGGIKFGNDGVVDMTLDASGNLLVGNTTSFSAVVRGQFAGASNGIYISSTAAAGTGDNLIAGFHTGSTIAPGTLSFAVATNGNVTNTNNSYGAISDIKLKENITDATPKLAGINQVRVVNYNLISSPDVKQLGVVAQELEQIFPGMVDETPDRDEDGNDLGTVTKSVKYSVFVPMLIKAMQEQQAIIEALTARLEALEGAN